MTYSETPKHQPGIRGGTVASATALLAILLLLVNLVEDGLDDELGRGARRHQLAPGRAARQLAEPECIDGLLQRLIWFLH